MPNILVELSNAMAAAAEQAGESTVMVNARQRMPATGIAFSTDLILTANHVVERDKGIVIVGADGGEISATLAGRDPGTDLALLHLESPLERSAKTTGEAKVGQLVLALGRPSQAGLEASLGVISAVGGPIHTRHGSLASFIRTDTTPFPGFSGGPLVNADGGIVGLNTSGFGHGAALTIPADLAWKIAKQIAQHGSVRRGYLGVRSQGVEIPTTSQKTLNRMQATGLLVIAVEPNSPAESAGLIVGDIIVSLGAQPVINHDELLAQLSGDVVGKSTPVQVLRGGQPEIIKVKIGVRS